MERRAYKQEELLEEGKYRVLRVGNIFQGNNWYYSDIELPEDKYCYDGDLLYAWSCGFAPYIWKGEKAIYHYHIWKLKESKEVVDRKFLYYYLVVNTKRFLGGTHGSVMLHLTKREMEEQLLRLPSLSTQRQIASILSALDDKIEVNRRINDNLEQQAQALFKSWFVDFEPFKDGEFVESELGMIPKGWKVGTIGEICKFENGFAFKSETYVNNGDYKVITIKNVQDGYLDTNGANSVSCIPDKMPAYCNLNNGDILLSLTGNVGRCCFVTEDKLLLNQRVAKIKATINNHWGYVYTLFRTSDFKEKMIGIARGTAQANLSPVETSILQIVIPPLNISEAFSLITNDNYQTMITKTMESRRLAELRDALLPKLMSGELKVNEVEISEK